MRHFLDAIACGLGIGAEIDLMAFFTRRYFGLRDYAKLYGTVFGIFALGVGIGPALSGASFDRFHSYTPAFMIFEVMLAVSCLIFLRLGPYPFPAVGEALWRRGKGAGVTRAYFASCQANANLTSIGVICLPRCRPVVTARRDGIPNRGV